MHFTSPFQHILSRRGDPDLVSVISPNGRLTASVDSDGMVYVFDLVSRNALGELRFEPYRRFDCIAWLGDASFVIGNYRGETIEVKLLPDLNSRSESLASLVTIKPANNNSARSFCYDPTNNLLALSFRNEIQIWHAGHEQVWTLVDTIPCQQVRGPEWCASAMTFIGAGGQLCMVADCGIGLWTYADKSFEWLPSDHPSTIETCIVSPDIKTLAGATTDYHIYIWSLYDGSPYTNESRVFKIPTGRDWLDEEDITPPLCYLDGDSLLTADPIGTVYVISPKGETKHMFSIGENYFIRSIMAHEEMVYIVAIGPTCTTLLLGYTNNVIVHLRVARTGSGFQQYFAGQPYGIMQFVRTAVAANNSVEAIALVE